MKGKLAAGGVAVALLLAVLWLALGRPGATPTIGTDAAKALADQFLADVRTGKPDAAWAVTTADFKSFQGKDAFRAYVKTKPALKAPAAFESCEPESKDGLTLATCVYKPQSGSQKIKVVLAPDGGMWKVERLVVE